MKTYTQDEFLLKALQDIHQSVQEDYDYFKDSDDEDEMEIAAGHKEELDLLEKILPQVQSLDDLAEMDEEDIGFVYELLLAYESVFIVSHLSEEEHTQNESDLQMLQEIIDLFED